SGDRNAFAELIRRHHAKVMGLCLSMLRNGSLAEDAAQEVFIKAYRSLGRFSGDSSFSTWIYRIAANHCLDILRHEAREKKESLDSLLERQGDHAHRLFTAAPDAPLTAEDDDLIQRLLRSLPPDYQLILTLREIQGLSYKELTEALDCSLDAVK